MEDRVVISYQHGKEPTFKGERLLQLANQEENIRKFKSKANAENGEEALIVTQSQCEAGKGT